MKTRKAGRSKRPESRGSDLSALPAPKPVVNHLELLAQIEKGPCTYLATPDGNLTIEKALDRANTGDCLALAPGVYEHFFTTPPLTDAPLKPIRIFGVAPDLAATVINGGGHIAASHAFKNISFNGGLYIEAGAPRFHKCVFSSPRAALSVLATAQPRLTHCVFHDFGTSGLYAFPNSAPALSECIIIGPDDPSQLGPADGPAFNTVGIYCDDAAVDITKCQLRHCGTGILFVGQCNNASVRDTKITHCVGIGLHGTGGAAPAVVATTIADCAQRVGVAVRLEAGSRARLTGCTINGELDIRPGARVAARDNAIFGPLLRAAPAVKAATKPEVTLPPIVTRGSSAQLN